MTLVYQAGSDDGGEGRQDGLANQNDGVRQAWRPNPARRLMADEVREFRAILGLTQAGLAGALGVMLRAVEAWEASRDPTSPDTCAAITVSTCSLVFSVPGSGQRHTTSSLDI